jgi:hypothetical protein
MRRRRDRCRWSAGWGLAIMLCLCATDVVAVSVSSTEEDMVERAQDSSAAGVQKGAWIAVPIPIVDPAIGAGLQGALLYLHPKTSDDPGVPNATSGIVGMYTDTESWFAGGFHDGNAKEDLYRFSFLAGRADFNLDFYGLGDDPIFQDNPIPYNIQGDTLLGQLLRRIPGTEDWYLGVRYLALVATVEFGRDSATSPLPPVADDSTISSLGLMASFDSRDDNYYPTDGNYFELVATRDAEAWGSDFDFYRVTSFYTHYHPASDRDVLAFRVQGANVDGDAPFYLLPTLRLRGFPAGQFRDNASLSTQLEWRRKFRPRWGYVVFAEAGSTAEAIGRISVGDAVATYGAGLRWQVTESRPLNLSVDYGFSEVGEAVYVSVGERF